MPATSTLPARLGAIEAPEGGCTFTVWAPRSQAVQVHIFQPDERWIDLEPQEGGRHSGRDAGAGPGALYKYRLDGGGEWPDPASRSQPQGVHGPSEVAAASFDWTDGAWRGLEQERFITYELHVGTFSPQGTFDGVVPYLDYLADLGITALELMPVAQFPGRRNWGYDGVYPFAPQESYGGAAGLKRLVDAAHGKGLAVVLDVVYNHLGPEGNYLSKFGPYFTGKYATPWGDAVNFDDDGSGEVRRFVVENALYWLSDFHIDALRLDAVHAIFDQSPRHILEELSGAVHELSRTTGRRLWVFAESDENDCRLVTPPQAGGFGVDAQWCDDFHHSLYVLLTGCTEGYYRDYERRGLGDLAKAFQEGYVYTGQQSGFRGKPHGTSSLDIPAHRFIVCAQNHDQVGNRMLGERLAELATFEDLKLAAGVVILSPFLPLLFMGEEYGDPAPFLYFVDHSDPSLVRAVREGRRREFASLLPEEQIPDPQDASTFRRSRLNHSLRDRGHHNVLLELYRELIRLRKCLPALANLSKEDQTVTVPDSEILAVERRHGNDRALAFFHFGRSRRMMSPAGSWELLLDSASPRWQGPGSEDGAAQPMEPRSFRLLSSAQKL